MLRANRCWPLAISVPWMKQPPASRMATVIAGRRQLALPYAVRPAASFKEPTERTCEVIIVQQTVLLKRPPPSSVNAFRTAGVKLGIVCFALVASKCLNEYWHEFRPKASSLCSAENYYFKCNATMNRKIKHVWSRTLQGNSALQPTDVTIPRTVRKSVFGFRLQRPRKQRAQRHEGVSSCDVLPQHRHSQENTWRCPLLAVVMQSPTFRLSEYTLATEQVRRHCRTVSWWAALDIRWREQDSGMPWRWTTPRSQACCL